MRHSTGRLAVSILNGGGLNGAERFRIGLIVVGLIGPLVCVGLFWGCASSAPRVERPAAPAGLTAQTLSGDSVSLAGLEGEVVVLDFFSQYCEPCIDGLPAQVDLHQKYGDGGVKVMLVAQDEDPAVLAEFLSEEHPVPFAVAMDPEQKWFDAFEMKFVPGLVVLDREGRVAGRWIEVNESTHAEVVALVEQLASE